MKPISCLFFVFCLVFLGFLVREGSGDKAVNDPAGSPSQIASPEYADRQSCVECHEEICRHWQPSDHARAMAHASPETVRGDFGDVEFLHVGFDDLLRLTEREIVTFLAALDAKPVPVDPWRNYLSENSPETESAPRYNVPGRKIKVPSTSVRFDDLALAVFDTKEGVAEKLRSAMTDDQRSRFDARRNYREKLRMNRPGDIAAAQDRIVRTLRNLIEEGKIETKIGVRFKMYREADRFMIDTDLGPKEILFTLGVRPLQQYLVAHEGGRLQCLPVAWDTVESRWFHLYPKEQIPPGDELHWTAPLQNWNRMCADCHTTNLYKNFEPKTKRYRTTFTEDNVGCQACHGPCGEHVRVGRERGFTEKWDAQTDKHVTLLAGRDDREIVQSCVFCHARRRLYHEGPKLPETPALDWFVPESVDAEIYYPDGQLLEEAFEYGSFLQSKMSDKGVGCVNCHEPHTLELRYQGNRLCTQCHSPSIYDTAKHHFHGESTAPGGHLPGTQCVECHFPQSTYMVVDPRRDHSIRKPSPALTILAGTPNACSICHQDHEKGETLEWARDWVDRWYAEKRKATVGYSDLWPTEDHYALALAAGRRGDPDTEGKLLKVIRDRANKEFRPAIRASALALLGRFPPSEPILEACVFGLKDADPLVRLAAIQTMGQQSDEARLEHLPPLLNDPYRPLRAEAARVLARVSSRLPKGEMTEAFQKARQEFIDAQRVDSDQAASYLNLAVLEHDLAQGKIAEIQRWFAGVTQNLPPDDPAWAETRQRALELTRRLTDSPLRLYRESLDMDADFLPSQINLAMLHYERGETAEAEQAFREARRIDPDNPNTTYSLGLLYAETDRLPDAVPLLRQAADGFDKLLTDIPKDQFDARRAVACRVRYNLGLLFLQLKRPDEAESELAEIVRREPENIEFLYALAVLYIRKGEKPKAVDTLDRLIKQDPGNPQWPQMKAELR